MNVNALDFHKDEEDWVDEDAKFFSCLEEKLSYLLQLTIRERQNYLGEE